MAARSLTEHVKIGLALTAVIAVFVSAFLSRLRKQAEKEPAAAAFLKDTVIFRLGKFGFNAHQSFLVALLFLALFGTINYNRYNTTLLVDGYDEYDLLHYYMSAKYFDELGYFRLLPALIIADAQEGTMCPGGVEIYLSQDENGEKKRPISHALNMRSEVLSHFSEARWASFVQDTITIQRDSGRLSCGTWRQLLQDHGFNGTPTWVMTARPFAEAIPADNIKLIGLLDVVLIMIMIGAIFWAFGAEATLFSWIFIGICYSFRWPTISWVFFRYDWLVSMVIGICMIKKDKPLAGGAFFAYAALMRYFPALWLFGIAAKGVHALFTRTEIPLRTIWKRVPTVYYKMALGFFSVVAILLSLSIAFDGTASHKESLANMKSHVDPMGLSSMRQGLVVAMIYRGETDQLLISNEKRQMADEIETPVRIAGLVMMVFLGLFMSRVKDWEAVGLGLIPYFWLTTSSYYYYAMRLTAVVIHAADIDKLRNRVGLAMLLFIEVFSHLSEALKPENRYFHISIMGWLLFIYTLTIMGFLGHEWWRDRKAAAAASAESVPIPEKSRKPARTRKEKR